MVPERMGKLTVQGHVWSLNFSSAGIGNHMSCANHEDQSSLALRRGVWPKRRSIGRKFKGVYDMVGYQLGEKIETMSFLSFNNLADIRVVKGSGF